MIYRFFSSSSKQYDGDDGQFVDYFIREDQHILNRFHLQDEDDNDNTHLVDAIARRKQKILLESENIKEAIKENNYYRMVDRFERFFDKYLKDLL